MTIHFSILQPIVDESADIDGETENIQDKL
jgi:hypothetical protein